MGKLVTRDELGLDAPWYFKDAYWSSSNGPSRYLYEWPSEDFPYRLHIHNDKLFQQNARKIEIRRWIEHRLSDTVILDGIEFNYRKYYGASYDWDKSYEVRHGYARFSFESGESASAFALAFGEWIQTPTKWHPDRPEDEEYLRKQEEERS